MTVNLVKLCVGIDSVESLAAWIDFQLESRKNEGLEPEQVTTTRMIPKRADELLDGGSLFWVIKGNIQCRQKILAIRPFTDEQGINRCHIVLEPKIILTEWQPRRAFQGWRYLSESEKPADRGKKSKGAAELPPELRLELAELGLL